MARVLAHDDWGARPGVPARPVAGLAIPPLLTPAASAATALTAAQDMAARSVAAEPAVVRAIINPANSSRA